MSRAVMWGGEGNLEFVQAMRSTGEVTEPSSEEA